ncbi:MAG: hypothetical protein IIC50_24835, partial [Planctomycetes bacterium]|nr:hypothetical protein [Planctomycetota bacterium]
MRPVARYLMDVGAKQYNDGRYIDAEKTLLLAQDYVQYLPDKDRKKLDTLLESAHKAAIARKKALQELHVAQALARQNKPKEAREYLVRIEDNRYLSAKERQQVAALLNSEGPAKREKPGSLLGRIGGRFARLAARSAGANAETADAVAASPDVNDPPVQATEGPSVSAAAGAGNGGYIAVIKQKRKIIRDHVAAVMGDSTAKVAGLVSAGQFDAAQDLVDKAMYLVESNELHLGKDLTQRHTMELNELSARVMQARQESAWQADQEARKAAAATQKRLHDQDEIERQVGIIELLERAKAYKTLQRYDAALGQLESLLAQDPQNFEARALKRELEDIVYARRQRDIISETAKERADLFLKSAESTVPHAEELNYPKNWDEIVAKPTRTPDRAVELDPANARIYDQLEEIVDLSTLRPETSVREAVELLKNSVDPPLQIVVLWRDLEDNAEVDPEGPMDLDSLPNVRLGTALDSLVLALGAGFYDITYIVEGGVIKIGTREALPAKLETRIYNIVDLMHPPAEYWQIGSLLGLTSFITTSSLQQIGLTIGLQAGGQQGGGGGLGGGGLGGGGLGG